MPVNSTTRLHYDIKLRHCVNQVMPRSMLEINSTLFCVIYSGSCFMSGPYI